MLKTPVYRNKKLTSLAHKAPYCFGCGRQDETIVPAHNNEVRFGKGTGIKVSDALWAAVCSECHRKIDEGSLSREERTQLWTDAYIKTMKWLIEEGYLVVK